MSPASHPKNIRQLKKWNLAAQCILEQSAKEHSQSLTLTAAIYCKQTECQATEHEEAMAFNRSFLLSQKNMHQQWVNIPQARWKQEFEETRGLQNMMERTVRVIESLSQSIEYLSLHLLWCNQSRWAVNPHHHL